MEWIGSFRRVNEYAPANDPRVFKGMAEAWKADAAMQGHKPVEVIKAACKHEEDGPSTGRVDGKPATVQRRATQWTLNLKVEPGETTDILPWLQANVNFQA